MRYKKNQMFLVLCNEKALFIKITINLVPGVFSREKTLGTRLDLAKTNLVPRVFSLAWQAREKTLGTRLG